MDPLSAPLSALEQFSGLDQADDVVPAPDPAPAGWPCARCGAVVAFELSACQTCGAPFLTPGSRAASRRSPLDDVITRASDKRVRLAIMALGGTVLLIVLFGLMVLIGSLL